jgi:hypothetical protein
MFGHASTLRLGQYGILMNAALVIALVGAERQRRSWLGLGFSLAATKPNFSLLFFPILLVQKRWSALALTAIYCCFGSLVVWKMIHVDPIELTRQMLSQSSKTTEGDVGLLGIGISLGIPYRIAAPTLGLAGLLLACAVTWVCRSTPPLAIFASASVWGRLFFYHRQYDNVMLLFLLLALGFVAIRNQRVGTWVIFFLVGISLWCPFRLVDYTLPVRIILTSTWLVGLFTVLRHADKLAVPVFPPSADWLLSCGHPFTGSLQPALTDWKG